MIPNMIDPVPSDLVPVRDPLRVVQLGRLDSVKRVDHAMRAVGIAAQAFPGIRLEVYGRGPELEHLLELRSELGLEDVVSFPGFTEDPIEVLAGAAVSLMTSRREGFGLAVAESLAAGTPVVTYDVDYGPAELVCRRGERSGRRGWIGRGPRDCAGRGARRSRGVESDVPGRPGCGRAAATRRGGRAVARPGGRCRRTDRGPVQRRSSWRTCACAAAAWTSRVW